MKKSALGKELEFISWIKRDGTGTEPVNQDHIDIMQEDEFRMSVLSLTRETFIACAMNCFVVRIKK